MRHPFLRILVALFIGVVSPLCCCQAMALAGSVCNGRGNKATEAKSCCHGCPGESAPHDDQDSPHDHGQPQPGDCPSCPSCQGTSTGSGIKAEIKVPTFEQQSNAVATIALATLWNIEPLESQVAATPPDASGDPPFLKANREALRWHCALLV